MKISQENISRKTFLRRKAAAKSPATAQDYSLRLVSTRSYSEKQIAEKLIKKGFSTEDTAKAVKKLKDYGYLNDGSFAERLIENGKKRNIGKIKLSYELYNKGINKSLIEDLTEKFYPEEEEKKAAMRAVEKKKISLIKYEENSLIFKKKLYDFLQRRGFSSRVIEEILNSERTIT